MPKLQKLFDLFSRTSTANVEFRERQKFYKHIFILIFPFAILLFSTIQYPHALSFDEHHYVQSSRDFFRGLSDQRAEHPPLGKWIIGLAGITQDILFPGTDPYLGPRFVIVLFGLATLVSVACWLYALSFSLRATIVLTLLSAMNGYWLVMSHTAMLDMIATAFALWGAYFLMLTGQSKDDSCLHGLLGSLFLGFACATKWSYIPYLGFIFIFTNRKRFWAKYFAFAFAAYLLPFLWLCFQMHQPLAVAKIIGHQIDMWQLLASTSKSQHAYQSYWWQWIMGVHSLWFHFQIPEAVILRANTPLFFSTVVAAVSASLIWIRSATLNIEKRTLMLILLWLLPLLPWVIAPRAMMFNYYYLSSSVWVPALFCLSLRYIGKTLQISDQCLKSIFIGVASASVLFFLFTLPIQLGLPIPLQTMHRVYSYFY